MSGPTESVFTLEPWSAFGKKGAFDDGDFVAEASGGAPISHGDQEITLDGFPPNIFAPVQAGAPATHERGWGYGQRFLFDPGGDHEQIIEIAQPKGFDADPSLKIYLRKPLIILDGNGDPDEIDADVNLGMGNSAVVMIGNFPKKVTFITTAFEFDDRGTGACTNPGVSFKLRFGARREGPFVELGGITDPPDVPALPGGGGDGISVITSTLPPMAYMEIVPTVDVGDGGDTVFSLEMVRSEA
jgi:hypothetical protein